MLAMRGVSKTFGRARVLNDVDLTLQSGEVHALLGENGAGKSTLMKVLFGIVPPDAGEIEIDTLGAVQIESPRHALSLGIGLVSQELSLVPQLDVAQNIFLGQTAGLDIVPRGRHREAAVEILQTLAPHLRVDTPVSKLGMADRSSCSRPDCCAWLKKLPAQLQFKAFPTLFSATVPRRQDRSSCAVTR